MTSPEPIYVLFVCTGNICRSPMAEAIFLNLAVQAGVNDQFVVASAATTTWEVGERPHPQTQLVLRNHQIPLHPQKRAVQITARDYTAYDYIIAMDRENLRVMRPSPKIHRLLEFAPPGSPIDVPDPYYTGDFDGVYTLIETACEQLLTQIRAEKQL